MTVKELIAELQQLENPDEEIMLYTDDTDFMTTSKVVAGTDENYPYIE